jgi:Divergent InlB B-repeat domain/FG-GAP repeat
VRGGGTFPGGSSRTVTATPNPTSKFFGWSEKGIRVSGKPNYDFTLTADRNLTAHFKRKRLKNDLVVDRGSQGLWTFKNATTWEKIYAGDATAIAAGDLNGDGYDEIIFALATPAAQKGTFVRIGTKLNKIHPNPATNIAAGDFDGDGKDDLVANFQGVTGTFVHQNNADSWFEIHPESPQRLAVGDIDGSGKPDIIVSMSDGLFARYDFQPPWESPDPTGGEKVAATEVTGGAQGDATSTKNGSTWTRINTGEPSALAVGDPDDNDKDKVFAAFPNGLFTSPAGNTPWIRLDPARPTAIAIADLDNDGKDDIIAIFPGAGWKVRLNNLGRFKPLKAPPGAGTEPRNVVSAALD